MGARNFAGDSVSVLSLACFVYGVFVVVVVAAIRNVLGVDGSGLCGIYLTI